MMKNATIPVSQSSVISLGAFAGTLFVKIANFFRCVAPV